MEDNTPQQKGGRARAEKLSPEDRARIAREAAQARWEEPIQKVKAGAPDKPIRIADIEVPCYVLDDDRRVITMTGMTDTLNISRGGSMKRGMSRLELFVSGKLIKPFISNELYERVKNPIKFKVNKVTAYGYSSDTLIDIAEAVIMADNAGVLMSQQRPIAYQCRVITSSLTRIGLIALIDEATGYQKKRDSEELQKILSAYLLPEHRPWMQTIPEDFTNEIYRVYGWKRTSNNRGPRYAGKLIRQLIYAQMPKPVLPALDNANPANENWRRKRKHHQFLTKEQGLDHFRTLVITVMTLLRVSRNKGEFKRHWAAYFQGQGELDLGGA
jgi:hypothetical protein